MGCGASSGKSLATEADVAGQESMEMYFQELEKFTVEEMKDLEQIVKLKAASDAKGIVAKQMEMKGKRTAFKVTATRLLKECFDAWDVSGDGFLSKEESAKVFASIVGEEGKYLDIIAKEESRRILAHELGMSKKVFETYDVEDEEAVKKSLEEYKAEASRDAEEVDKAMQVALENYTAEKHGRDKAAFTVLDKSLDGRINKKEFMAAFDTTSDTYEAFLTALGLFEAPKAN